MHVLKIERTRSDLLFFLAHFGLLLLLALFSLSSHAPSLSLSRSPPKPPPTPSTTKKRFGAIYTGFVRGFWGFKYEYDYLPTKDLQIEVAGCDVVFYQMAAAATVGHIKVIGQWSTFHVFYCW